MTIERRVLCATSVTLLTCAVSHAAQMNWTAPGSGSFQDPSNWSLGSVPGSNDLVVLDAFTAGTTISFGDDVETLSFEIWDGTYVLDLNGHVYTLTDIVAPFNFVGPGQYDLTIEQGTLRAWRAFMTEIGAWTIASDASAEIETSLVIGHSGIGIVTVDGGALSAGSVHLGQGAGEGVLHVRNGGVATINGPVDLESFGSAVSQFVVSGVDSRADGITKIECTTGHGQISIVDGGAAETGIAWIGFNAMSIEAIVATGGTWTITDELMVDDGAVVIASNGLVDAVGVDGTEVTGGTIAIQDGGTLRTTRLERFGGSILLDSGATLEITSEDLFIGTGGPFGSLTLNADTEVIVHQNVTVAKPGGGTNITLVGGAMTVGGDVHLGNGANSQGAIQLGSSPTEPARLDVAGHIRVGFDNSSGLLGLYGANDVVETDSLTIHPTGVHDQQAGSTFSQRLTAVGPIDQASGLLAIGDDPPAEHTSGLVVNDDDGNGGNVFFGDDATTQGAWLATGINGYARVTVGGRWTCNGPLVAGRPDGEINVAYIDVFDEVDVIGEVTLYDGVSFQLAAGAARADHVENHGLIFGYGILDGDLTNEGVLDPTSFILDFAGGVNPGVIELWRTYEQTANGTLDIAIESATENDSLLIAGATQLGGTLKVELLNGYEPPLGAAFEIIRVGEGNFVTGTFDVEPPGYDVIYLAQSVLVTRTDACPADIDDSGEVGFADLLLMIAQWGVCPTNCPWDLDGSDQVGFNDVTTLLNAWGPCGDS